MIRKEWALVERVFFARLCLIINIISIISCKWGLVLWKKRVRKVTRNYFSAIHDPEPICVNAICVVMRKRGWKLSEKHNYYDINIMILVDRYNVERDISEIVKGYSAQCFLGPFCSKPIQQVKTIVFIVVVRILVKIPIPHFV